MAKNLVISVFCGSESGYDSCWAKAAQQLGNGISQAGYTLIYGGGKTGLMGILADTMLENGGNIIGVLPQFLASRHVGHAGLTQMRLATTLHERKKIIYEEADIFVALPGGIGTLDEVSETLAWTNLDQHHKPLILANIQDFWRPFLDLLAHFTGQGFLPRPLDREIKVRATIDEVLETIDTLSPTHPSLPPDQKTGSGLGNP